MLKKLLTKKFLPILIGVSVLLVCCIVGITILSVNLAKGGENSSVLVDESSNLTADSSSEEVINSSSKIQNTTSKNNVTSKITSTNNLSSETHNPTPGKLLNPGNYKKVEYSAMPTDLTGVTMTEAEMLKKYRGYTDWRIYSIRTAKDEIKPKKGGTAYYISNRGHSGNDGKSPNTPLATLEDLTYLTYDLKAGDVVYFERGSIFRGSVQAKVEGVTYAAYGTGKKPEIRVSPYDGAREGQWIKTKENPKVYRYSEPIIKDVGTLVFNDGEKNAVKCVVRTEEDGSTYNNTTGERFNSFADLNKDLYFYHDYLYTGYIYLYCEKGSPADVFDSIEFNVNEYGIGVTADNVHIDNLCIKYTGAHGIGGGTRKGLKVTNCEFAWIGGSILSENFRDKNYGVRYGNGVELYGGCDNYEVSNCYFTQIYDAAITFQYDVGDSGTAIMQNVNFSNNVIEYCHYSIEYWLEGTSITSYIKDVRFENNLMWYAGYGFGEDRPKTAIGADAHVKSWSHENRRKGEFIIENNLFAIARSTLVQTNATADYKGTPIYNGNTYIQFKNGKLGTNHKVYKRMPFDDTVGDTIKSMLFDNNAKIIYIK